MLRKLMKHELRATGRIMLPLFLILLVTAVSANISTRTLLEADNRALNALGVLFMTAFALAIAAVCIMSFVLMIQRFYKNLLQDEGYVMMTLPVSVHQHVISKLLVSMLWAALSVLVVAAAIFILAYEVGAAKEAFNVIKALFAEIADAEYILDAGLLSVEFALMLFFGAAASCLNFYLALTIGHSFANRKLLMSILAYFAIQFVLEIAVGILSAVFFQLTKGGAMLNLEGFILSAGNLTGTHAAMLCIMIATIVSAALFYFPTAWFLKNRLNLE